MKKTSKLTFAAVFAALGTVFMMVSYFPYLTYSIPAVAGLFVMVIFLEAGISYAVGGYVVTAFLSVLFAEKEAAALYLCLLGFYPIVKAVIERLKKPVLEWIIKIILFNGCAVLFYFISTFIMGVSFDELNAVFKWGIYAFWGVCNPVFVLYDIAVSRIAMFYTYRLHGRVQKIFKG